MSNDDKKSSLLSGNARLIERHLCSYMGYDNNHSAVDFLTSLSNELLSEICPSALELPAALVVQEEPGCALISIHMRHDLYETLNRESFDTKFLASDTGLSAFLILVEEISHFHLFSRHAQSETPLTRFEMEMQAEVEKIIVASLVFYEAFGRSYVRELTKKIFDESIITGKLTDYRLASRVAEKFWKLHLKAIGENLIFNSTFRRLVQGISRKTGQEKQLSFEEETIFIAA